MLLLLFAPQPAVAQVGYANLSLSLDDCWFPLNAASSADALFWTADELIGYMDEAAKRLARVAGVFVERNESITVTSGQGSYSLPARHIETLQADLANRTLRPRNVQQLEALDADWPDTLGDADNVPKAFVQDTQGFDKIAIYPKPYVDPETVGLVRSTFPETLEASDLILPIPPIMRDYFTFAALASARAKEGHGSMDEVVPWLRSIVEVYDQAATGLWGTTTGE